ncbi:sensor histidine kinase [Clostridium guangxiense]|uniref:sensor histidine kinase n=1 Tax=Clostridium guangxiense TaxID=1662055 RepID=UPI001E30AD58|nr:HAMP domain-containing histidine kinase [Clostridium guangxiense]
MSIKTKLVLSNIAMCLIPLLLCVITFLGLQNLYLQKIHSEYNMSTNLRRREIVINPYAELRNINFKKINSIISEIERFPNKVYDENFLKNINNEFAKKNSYIVVKKEKKVIFDGGKNDASDLNLKLSHANDKITKMPDFFMANSELVAREFLLNFSDGTQGSLIFVIDTSKLFNIYKEFLTALIVSAVLIIILISGLLTFLVSRSILIPLKSLRKGTENIKNGDLDFEVKANSKDEIGELCEDFDDMRKKLKESIELQNQYENNRKELISNISHDLKTPITSIKGYVEGIRDGVADTPEKMEKYINTIYTKSQSMDYLIDELLTYSKLDMNKMHFDFQKIDITSYMEDLMEEIRFDVEKKKIKFSYKNNIKGQVIVKIDVQNINRVIMNIISNSIKYMDKEEGKIEVNMYLKGDEVIIGIKDNGKGISKNALSCIFDRFYREDYSRNSLTGGSGLGLAICKKIIEEHGGRIWAESEEKIGTAMWFTIKIYN